MTVCILLIISVCSLSAEHVFVNRQMNWINAQAHCRTYFTDLSPISNELEEKVFTRSVTAGSSGWIGLYKDSRSPTGWKWSGGDNATYLNMVSTLLLPAPYVFWLGNKWYPGTVFEIHNVFCLRLIVVEEKVSWEEALEYCRENHSDLTSILSETQRLLALSKIQDDSITDPVWIGLRYLSDRWLWVNTDPLMYEAWPQGQAQENLCPVERRCGALTKKGLWENWDCQEKLNFICF